MEFLISTKYDSNMVPPNMVPPNVVAPNTVVPNTVVPNSRFKFFGHIHKFKVMTLVESVASLHSLLDSNICIIITVNHAEARA